MEPLQLQLDDLREQRQAWKEYEEWRRDEEQYRREEWPGYRSSNTHRGVFEMEISEE